ncbi:DUF4906 domain-containing protein [Parabacteroides sp. BX2]|jgi:hypothetical protein|uniref:DUF4906 domain-containing protein n=2 Tax=Parabacteroides TaxID=375288 RepID=A0ABR7E0A3_9BACT|nr:MULTISPECIES: DUF4906 domain-containing protein [Parabacteroides]MBC5643180.1 DUF4906 domain-containing protein [Parabacteroides segnis]MCM0713016.1 DUF4906 domain-containing protein [Parabacteroides sp. TA-V-105]
MASIGHKLETKGVIMTLLSLVLISTGCEEQIDPPAVNPSEGKTVAVTLDLGIADEEDGAGATASPTSKAGSCNRSAFEIASVADMRTKAAGNIPDKLYNLDIIQYVSGGSVKSNTLSEQTIGAALGTTTTVKLTPDTGSKLLLVARGASADFGSLTGKTLSAVQDLKVKAETSKIKGISTDATGNDLANMPYYLYLENVNITSDGKIQSPAGKDVRLLLKRLAVKVQLDWSFSKDMTDNGYILKEVKLCQVPAHYRLVPQTEKTDKWGNVYPTSVAEFVDVYRLTGTNIENGTTRTQTVWIPANARGISSYSNSPYYRNKTNANPAATYAEFVVDNSEKKERLYYRVYLGGNETDDFNLLENTNYHWTVNINKADYANDPRIQLLDQTPVISTNQQTTSNCFMMLPGTNICFNPYKHEAGTDGWNTYLTSGGAIASGKTITSVKVLWQTKDAGTSGDLVMGYVASNDNHKNLVNYENLDNPSTALVHVKVPVTNGGNAVIAAYSGSTVVWSWHLWISNYVPVRINSYSEYEEAQAKTKNGTVHKYRSALFNEGQKYANCVMMDRDLGAVAGGYPAIYKGENYTVRDNVETQGFLYQGARKDPFFISADGTTNEVDVIYDGDGVTLGVTNTNPAEVSNKYEYSIQHPLHFIYGEGGIGSNPNSWDNSGKKTIDDPCPTGWRVPLFDGTGGSSNFSGSIFDGFQTGGSISGSGNDAEYIISGTNEFNYSSYFLTDELIDKAPGTSPDKNPKGGRLFYLGENKLIEKTIHNTVWFPVSAERVYTTAQLNAPLYAHIWFANNASGNFMFGSGMKPHAMRVIRYTIGYGWPVRCIQQ